MTWDKDYNDKKLSARLFQVAIIAAFWLYKFRIMAAIAIIVIIACFCTWAYGGTGYCGCDWHEHMKCCCLLVDCNCVVCRTW